MNQIVLKNTASHYIWGENCDGWWLKNGGHFSVIEEQMPPNTAEKRHFHQKTEQFFYCLEGIITIEDKTDTRILQPYEGFTILPGNPHKILNNSALHSRFLVISSSKEIISHADRIDLE